MVINILEQLRQFKRKIKNKIRCYEDMIQERTTRSYTDEDRICNVKLQSLITCSLCKTLDSMSIMAWCTTCSKLVCSSCVLIHLTNTTDHSIEYDKNYRHGYKYKRNINVYGTVKAIQCVSFNLLTLLCQRLGRLNAHFVVVGLDGSIKHDIELSRYNGMLDIGFIVPFTDDLVAVTHDTAAHMEVINYTNGCILHQVPTHREDGEKIKGVALISNQIFVGFSNGIDILTMSGERLPMIDLKDVQILRPVGNGKLFCRHRNQTSSDIINSYIDIPNNTISTLTEFPCNPMDITMDDEGNFIFVQNGVVFQADHSGHNSKIIITYERNVECLSFKYSSKSLYIADGSNIRIYSKD